jgi:dTDP-4-amino-4,6-dideoxygalactose transaminase
VPSRAARPDDILVRIFDQRLLGLGDTPQGAYWPSEADRHTRFDIMLDVLQSRPDVPVVLCDLGCGTGELLAHLRRRGVGNVSYVGVDRSKVALSHARRKFPDVTFIEMDVNAPDADLDQIACDYMVVNGLFTAKFDLSHDEMWAFLVSTITRVWPKIRRGLAFNVMSKIVDWERDDLFHLPLDDAAKLLHRLAGRRVRFRADYGLYEYTAFAFKPDDVPVLRPQLPHAERLVPYLRRLDRTRVYTNHGSLQIELERRIEACLGLQPGGFACASSGTAALSGAILASAGRATAARPLALIPAFTFVATAVAVEQCGYKAHLVDVDAETWMLDPEQLVNHPALSQVGTVIPVAPFGRPVPQEPWLAFRERTGIPVVIDGAASFDRVMQAPEPFLGVLPVVLSFHATKAFGLGEGGGVATTDLDLMSRVVQALNFGFGTTRDAQSSGMNGKMSEYHAAVGLAELDMWPDKQAALAAVIESYRQLAVEAGFADRFVGAPTIGLSYALFRCRDGAEAERIQAQLRCAEIGTRLWYGAGLHHQTYFSKQPRDTLSVTEAIAPTTLGLPMAPDLTRAEVNRVVSALAAALTAADAPHANTGPRSAKSPVKQLD